MNVFIIYLIKASLCSAILFAYYRSAYCNRGAHQWSRFYLLGSILVSLVIPLITIPLHLPVFIGDSSKDALLDIVVSGRAFHHDDGPVGARSFTMIKLAPWAYVSVSVLISFFLLRSLFRLAILYQRSGRSVVNGVTIAQTSERSAPFTFFKVIFWNRSIDLDSPGGRMIFDHEFVHARENHSLDRLLMDILVIIFWLNPVFWLIRREIMVVHEFIADEQTMEGKDAATFSQMILETVFPGSAFGISSSFFTSPIKRRLSMLKKNASLPVRRISKILVLPLLALLFAAFTSKRYSSPAPAPGAASASTVVVIDAGHGGDIPGAIAADGTLEKDINLAIALKTVARNQNQALTLILTRQSDENVPLPERVDQSVRAHATAFVSLHMNSDKSGRSGFELVISKRNLRHEAQSHELGALLARNIHSIYPVDLVAPGLTKGSATGVWVLDAPSIDYPAVLIECGNLLNEKDVAFVNNPANQEKIADQILQALNEFAGKRR